MSEKEGFQSRVSLLFSSHFPFSSLSHFGPISFPPSILFNKQDCQTECFQKHGQIEFEGQGKKTALKFVVEGFFLHQLFFQQ